MAMTLDDIVAELEIRRMLYNYCRGVDRGDADLIASAYHADGLDHHGAWHGLGSDFATHVVTALDPSEENGQHHITNVLIERDGDKAQVESYFIALNPMTPQAGGGRAFVTGRYLDKFEKRDGDWKIADRTVVMDSAEPATKSFPDMANYLVGARREADPSHDWLGQK